MNDHLNLHKYDDEIETLYGEHDFNPNISFAKNYAKNNIWAAFYSAAREVGMPEDMAKQFIDSKWFRHNEEEIYQQLTATLFTMLWSNRLRLEPYIDRGDVE
tara:strand:+ start:147 stop:452 length:306 start_codon:yes stop_codon:yes gene_type:complete